MLTSNELELSTSLTLGTLKSNAETIRDLVAQKLADYTPENYEGRADDAKADRAVLNKAEQALNAKRLELERSYMAPFDEFKKTITETCKMLKNASAALDEIVKGEESREKEAKRQEIQKLWDDTGFDLFPLEKVFDTKWLNKTTKIKDITTAISTIQQKTFDELKVLENFPAEDVALLKTVYLDTLNITEAMKRADQLKANRDRLAKEKAERELREQRLATDAQRKDELTEQKQEDGRVEASNLADVALGLDIKEVKGEKRESIALLFTGTFEQLMKVRRFLTEEGLTYKKLTDHGDGIYIDQEPN